MSVGSYEDPEELPDELKNTKPYPPMFADTLNPEDLNGHYDELDPRELGDYDPTKDWE